MKLSNDNVIKQSFMRQSKNFWEGKLNFEAKEYLDFVVTKIEPMKADTVLEVTAGTYACGRSLAPFVQNVACLDMTPVMLLAGREKADEQGIKNMIFIMEDAGELPFLNDSFDIVMSHLAFHRFPDINRSFDEMVRVLRTDRKLILIDMEAAENNLRSVRDEIETMRDASHIRNLSKEEMLNLYLEHSLQVDKCEITEMPALAENWLAFTETSMPTRQEIMKRFENDVKGIEKTGFYPYQTDKGIFFNHKWILIIGRKLSIGQCL